MHMLFLILFDIYFIVSIFMKISDTDLVDIMLKIEQGEKVSNICRTHGVHRSTTHRRVKVYQDEKRLGRKKTVRPKKVSRSVINDLESKVKDRPFIKLRELRVELNNQVSIMSISRYCKQIGLSSKVSPKRFMIM